MCVIILQPKGAHLEKDRAKRMWKANSDGGGFAYINDSGVVTGQKHMDFEPFWSAFEQARSEFPQRAFLLHMRIATHGSVSLANVHPFVVDDHTVMAHNGIIHHVPEYKNDDRSDTRVFIDEVLPSMPEGWLDDPYLPKMVEEWIGWSKLAFLTTDPSFKEEWYIINESSGAWADGMWFSNKTGLHPYPKYTANKGVTYINGKPSHWDRDLKKYVPNDAATVYVQKGSEMVPYTEGTNDWDAWDAQDAGLPGQSSGSEDEQSWWDERRLTDKAKDQLVDIRLTAGLTQDIMFLESTQTWECWGCDEDVDVQTGQCDCWDKVCLDCEAIAEECKCTGKGSYNLAYIENADPGMVARAMSKVGG